MIETKHIAALVVGVLADLADYFGFFIFLLPVLGDVPDVITTIIITGLVGPIGLFGFAELIPGEDILPTFIAVAVAAIISSSLRGGRKR